MSDRLWKNLPAGPALRRIVAERLGWHMRRIWVGSGGIEYDFIVYDNDDRIVYQREITGEDLDDEQAAVDQVWQKAVEDENCPRWDEDLVEALDLVYGMEHSIKQENGQVQAWVKSPGYTGDAPTEPLAVVRAWLTATEDDPAYFH